MIFRRNCNRIIFDACVGAYIVVDNVVAWEEKLRIIAVFIRHYNLFDSEIKHWGCDSFVKIKVKCQFCKVLFWFWNCFSLSEFLNLIVNDVSLRCYPWSGEITEKCKFVLRCFLPRKIFKVFHRAHFHKIRNGQWHWMVAREIVLMVAN